MKKVLILGVNSYIGTSFQNYVEKNYPNELCVDKVSLRGDAWKTMDWSVYDSILNVTGKAHADIGSLTEQEKAEYYEVNCELACEAYKKAIRDGAAQYIYLSSIIVYGDSSNSRKPVIITKNTKPSPSNFYGDSKWKAEQKLERIFETEGAKTGQSMPYAGANGRTRLAIIRPPMIYGAGCKGNYQTLRKMAAKVPVFPDYRNVRSMLYIGNLCEFLRLLVDYGDGGLFFPQNQEYVKTAELIRLIGERQCKKIVCLRLLAPAVAAGKLVPGKLGGLVRKAFGSLVYEKSMSEYQRGAYQRYSLRESVEETEERWGDIVG